MPKYSAPGVYIEEVGFAAKPIEGVSTSTAGFVGLTRRGPFAAEKVPRELTSFARFEEIYGGTDDLKCVPKTNYVAHAAKAFFDEGGQKLFVARVRPGKSGAASVKDWQNALDALLKVKGISIVAAPGSTEQGRQAGAIQSRLIAQVDSAGVYRFAVLDIPKNKTPAEAVAYCREFNSKNAAFYYPWVTVADNATVPPSGFICGIYARNDSERGVAKAPANELLRGVIGLERLITHAEQELLNSAGVNCLRYFADKTYRVWGARTASSDPEWKYVNVRRLLNFLEESIDRGMQWVMFEPNDESLWARMVRVVSSFLYDVWRRGALMGTKPELGFFVRCDRTTMTQNDIDNGRLICLVGVAPTRPAEFVIIRIARNTAS